MIFLFTSPTLSSIAKKQLNSSIKICKIIESKECLRYNRAEILNETSLF